MTYQQPLFQFTKDRDGKVAYMVPPTVDALKYVLPHFDHQRARRFGDSKYGLGRIEFVPKRPLKEVLPMEWIELRRTYATWYHNPIAGAWAGSKEWVV
jgi:hypothetical protein